MCEVVVRTRDKGADNDIDEWEDAAAVHAGLNLPSSSCSQSVGTPGGARGASNRSLVNNTGQGDLEPPDLWFWRPVLCGAFPHWQAKLSCCGTVAGHAAGQWNEREFARLAPSSAHLIELQWPTASG